MKTKIAVIGDAMLDVYHLCKNRMNPESSAQCFTVEETKYRPGGAGNVAVNLARLGSDCTLISVVGEDEDAGRLEGILRNAGVNPIFFRDRKRITIVKERYMSSGDGRYHFRADFERKACIEGNHVHEILECIKEFPMVLVSDYDKGAISGELIEGIKSTGTRIAADTKPGHQDLFKDVFMIKPNVREVREMTGMKDETFAAQTLGERLRTNVLLTRGKEGLVYFGTNGYIIHSEQPSVPKEKVIDVTGAGDTVMATFCHFLLKGYQIGDCVRLSNMAGGISVQYPGCYQVSEEELGIKT